LGRPWLKYMHAPTILAAGDRGLKTEYVGRLPASGNMPDRKGILTLASQFKMLDL